MVGKTDKTPQLNIFKIPLNLYIKPDHELCLLSKKIDWDKLEEEFSQYYCSDKPESDISHWCQTVSRHVISEAAKYVDDDLKEAIRELINRLS